MQNSLSSLTVSALYTEPTHSLAFPYFANATYPWELLASIPALIREIGATLSPTEYECRDGDVWIAKNATVAPSASIAGPCIIGEGAEVRHCAFLRGGVLVGARAVVGNSTELKNCILFDEVQVPHYNYVGDSILGYKAHLGAGALTSNVKSDKSPVVIRMGDECVHTERKKVGAMLGDRVEVGCHTVLNPGTVVGHDTNIYPLSSVRGYVPPDSIYKSGTEIVPKQQR